MPQPSRGPDQVTRVGGLDQAKKAMAAAEAKARQNNWNVVISIVDSGGRAVMLQRLHGSHLAAIGIAEGKARTAVEFRRPTKALEDAMASGGVGLKYFTVRGAMLIECGIPIVVDGKIVGGRGCGAIIWGALDSRRRAQCLRDRAFPHCIRAQAERRSDRGAKSRRNS